MSTVNKAQAKQIQRALRETVEPTLKVDGSLGNLSLEALKKFAVQTAMKVPTDFSGEAFGLLSTFIAQRYVSEEAFAQTARTLGVEEAVVRALAEVESRQDSYLPDGRLTILFERHWFYRKLQSALAFKASQDHVLAVLGISIPDGEKNRSAKVLEAVVSRNDNICSAATGGYKGNGAEWGRLEEAVKYDSEAAYASASYGGFQIMGFNHNRCGYNKPSDMMLGFAKSESDQFIGVCNFIRSDAAMLAKLRAKNWAAFAEAYNGSDYRKNKYDEKLATAYAKWVKQLAAEAAA